MEKSENKIRSAHELKIVNREKGSLTGIEKVISSCETSICLVSGCGNLSITGEKLRIIKFDADTGALDFEGTVNSLKYSGAKQSLIKRIFK